MSRAWCGLVLWLVLWLISINVIAIACEESGSLNQFVQNKYPDTIVFDVFRNKTRVGEHKTVFQHLGNEILVTSKMELVVRVFFVPVYRFMYLSEARWCGGRLTSIESLTDRNGDSSEVIAIQKENKIVIDPYGDKIEAVASIMPTNHWNPEVLNRSEVLNTITGRVNQVEVTRCENNSTLIKAAVPEAECYQYEGELDTRVWYDKQLRWVGLQFEGDDGSAISYVCQKCQ